MNRKGCSRGISRRDFLKRIAAFAGATVMGTSANGLAAGEIVRPDGYGVLVDTTSCIGCRRCEWACNEWNKNPNQPMKSLDDKKVCDKPRKLNPQSFTVVNRFKSPKAAAPVYVKRQCMHCEDPACLSACFVHAFTKTRNGSVVYNPDVCVGCRYCMVACPFDIPTYEYNDPITPRIRKCTFCFDRTSKEGRVPACVEMCPTETLIFGKRNELVKLAHQRINMHPRTYIDHVYGEHEVGGTSWLYLSGVPFEELGLRTDLGNQPIPGLSKGFLFTVKTFEIVAVWPLVFAAFYALSQMRDKKPPDKHTDRKTDSPEAKRDVHGKK